MYTSLEIEIKSQITEEEYKKIINKYHLEGTTFIQTNYYFDTTDHKLINSHIILRIREKEKNIKLTSKSPLEVGTLEKHIILTKKEAYEMIENGFDANIIGLDYRVNNVAKLQTERTTMPYKSGKLFFDKNTYYDTVDYEIEFESDDEVLGKEQFLQFLTENGLTFNKIVSKSKRAYKKSSQL